MPQFDTSIVWFRRDLRTFDHAALHQALVQSRQVVCVFVFDREILDAVENAQLEERLLTREAGMEFVRREFPLGAEKNDAPGARAEC